MKHTHRRSRRAALGPPPTKPIPKLAAQVQSAAPWSELSARRRAKLCARLPRTCAAPQSRQPRAALDRLIPTGATQLPAWRRARHRAGRRVVQRLWSRSLARPWAGRRAAERRNRRHRLLGARHTHTHTRTHTRTHAHTHLCMCLGSRAHALPRHLIRPGAPAPPRCRPNSATIQHTHTHRRAQHTAPCASGRREGQQHIVCCARGHSCARRGR